MSDDTNSNLGSSLLRFFGRPAVGIAMTIASIIIPIAVSCYFYFIPREKAELTYFVHPAKAAVVRTGQASGLSVKYGGQDLTTDVTAAQIAFWNAGSKPIRANTVLSPLIIRVGNNSRILEANLRKKSREVVQIMLGGASISPGEVEVNWNILEQNDGGVLQIIYTGDEKVNIQAHAILEGQPEIIEAKYEQELRTPGEEYVHRRGMLGQLPAYSMILLGVFAILMFVGLCLKKSKRGQKFKADDLVPLVLGTIMMLVGIWALRTQLPPWPPFGF